MMEIDRNRTDWGVLPSSIIKGSGKEGKQSADKAKETKDEQQSKLEQMRKSLKERAEEIGKQSAAKIAEAVTAKNGGKKVGLMTVGGVTKNSTSQASKAKQQAIRQKLKRGKKLSGAEMKYLRDTDPATYQKAKAVQEAREQLERDLKRCATRAEARQAMVRASIKVAAQAAAGESAATKSVADGGASVPAPAVGSGEVSADTAAANVSVAVDAEGTAVDAGASANVSAPTTSSVAVNVEAQDATAESGGAANGDGKLKLNVAGPLAAGMEAASVSAGADENPATDSGNKNTGIRDGDTDNRETGSARSSDMCTSPSSTLSSDDLPQTVFLIIRALQDEYNEFHKSRQYDEMPEDIGDKDKARKAEPGLNATPNKALDAYWSAMNLTDAFPEEA